MKHPIAERLAALRASMAEKGVNAVIIPHADPHQSEHPSDHWQLRRYFSGFNGSAGDLVVTTDKALLWTDSRYFLQAAQQLDGTEVILMKDGLPDTPSITQWLIANMPAGSTVAIDGMAYSATGAEKLVTDLAKHHIDTLVGFDAASVWTDRPPMPKGRAFIHDLRYAGERASDKIAAALDRAHADGADSIFISTLDEIAWLLNLRADDVRYHTLLTSFLYLSPRGNVLLVDPEKITAEVRDYLTAEGVTLASYDDVLSFIDALPADDTVLVEPARNAVAIVRALGSRAVIGDSPVALAKACKNDTQISGVRNAMARDGVALINAFMEIERRVYAGEPLTELGVVELLRHYRSQQPGYFSESFGSIVGYGPHGAIVHYEPTAESDVAVRTGNLLLVDSGAQYLDGTTDITRTITLGQPTEQQKRDFTLVLKGHIALGSAIFPAGTTGHQLDALARQFLWAEGLTYLHGTGHGVGFFLNVHEGPQSIRLNYVPTPLMPGMITSNEPGLYRENLHGIRCENLVLTVPAMHTEFGEFLRFEPLTMFPFDTTLLDMEILTDAERAWINNYHATVRSTLLPLLTTDEQREWLRAKTAAI